MHHFALDGVRSTQNGVGVLDSAMSQQVAHIGGAPCAHCLGLVLHITFSPLAHGGILPEDQRTHAQLAGESAKEENV